MVHVSEGRPKLFPYIFDSIININPYNWRRCLSYWTHTKSLMKCLKEKRMLNINCGSLDQHRFARKKLWIVDEAPPPLSAKSSDAALSFVLESSFSLTMDYFDNLCKKNGLPNKETPLPLKQSTTPTSEISGSFWMQKTKSYWTHTKSLMKCLKEKRMLNINCGSLDQHRFARKKLWIVDEAPPPLSAKSSDAGSFIDLLLEPSEEDLKIWPHML
ncbi:hypothetical protein CTI12_AA019240 [Artemisia annua]|uniref:Uncharacterized protein n=1 Tax=Artemisia annua TaxID=35608 RepID=A0A2U1QJH1_ARTAN|nr:hypothetical protein CTI12_AA019240 [Artemisia annua]